MNAHSFLNKPKTLAWALLSAGMALSDAGLAAEAAPPFANTNWVNQWAQVVVYAVTPYCQVLSNGLRVCQPIGLVGPAPNSPAAAYQPLVRVPLAPPSLQPPGMPAITYPPYGVNPFLPGQAMPFLPWPAVPGNPPAMTTVPAAGTQATAELPSIVPPATPAAMATAASPEPVTATAPIQPGSAAATEPAETAPSAPAVTASRPPAEPGADAAAALTAAQAVIAHFDFDRAELTEAGRATLDAWLARNAKVSKVVVTGHADRLGPAAYNLDLSRRRAQAARDYLVKKGMDPSLITIEARGETQPVIYCKGGLSPATIACLSPNRRIVINP